MIRVAFANFTGANGGVIRGRVRFCRAGAGRTVRLFDGVADVAVIRAVRAVSVREDVNGAVVRVVCAMFGREDVNDAFDGPYFRKGGLVRRGGCRMRFWPTGYDLRGRSRSRYRLTGHNFKAGGRLTGRWKAVRSTIDENFSFILSDLSESQKIEEKIASIV